MNKIYIILMIIVLGANTTPIWSQCTDQDISTHPSSAVNTLDPDKTNHFFDWEADVFQINSSIISADIESPFDQLSNSNIAHFRYSLDRLHQDGWELIDYDFGYQLEKDALTGEVTRVKQAGNGVVNPFFILYNKYTGVMRIFVAIGQQYSGYSSAEFTLMVNSEKQPSVLNDRNVVMPLDDFVKTPTVKAVSTFINEPEKWLYADFLTQYDPCVCNFPSSMQLEVKLIDDAKITLTGSSTGDIFSVTSKGIDSSKISKESLSIGITDIAKSVNNASGVYKKAWSSFKGSDEFAQKQKEAIDTYGMTKKQKDDYKKDLTIFQSALKDSKFLQGVLKNTPYISTALTLLDVFVGGGKKADAGPQEVKLHPMSVQMNHNFAGEIISTHTYVSKQIRIPGSDNMNLDLNDRPYYNKPMGIFNLTETPEMYVRTEEALDGVYNGAYPFSLMTS